MAGDKNAELEIGRRYRAAYLVEQADYTEKLAKKEASLLAPFGIDKRVFDQLVDLKSKVNAALKDRTLASADAQAATSAQNEAFAKAKSWLRRAIIVGRLAYVGDAAQAEEFTKGPKIGRSVPLLGNKLKAVIGLLQREPATTAKFGASPAFMKTGQDLWAALSQADATQELKKISLPKGTEDFYRNKAKLFFLLKQFNLAGSGAHVDDPVSAGADNLSILYRRGVHAAKKDAAVTEAKA